MRRRSRQFCLVQKLLDLFRQKYRLGPVRDAGEEGAGYP
jgi:hypothetical protein